ncbi:MAG: hypothetical protein GYB68_12305 [Chloroflexi bacterium]|nr:hypothetical protein [Chloroflexota bacterium]
MIVLVIVLGIAVVVLLAMLYSTNQRLSYLRGRNRQLRNQLRDLEFIEDQVAQLTALGEVTYNALMVVDQSHIIIYMNGAARALFQSSSANSRRHATSVMAATRNHEFDNIIYDLLRDGQETGQSDLEEQITIRGCAYRLHARYVQVDRRPYAVVAMEDVSELQRLGRARRDMVANISHELKTPITSIRLQVDTLLRGAYQKPKRVKSHLKLVADNTDLLQQMVQ